MSGDGIIHSSEDVRYRKLCILLSVAGGRAIVRSGQEPNFKPAEKQWSVLRAWSEHLKNKAVAPIIEFVVHLLRSGRVRAGTGIDVPPPATPTPFFPKGA